ncbi:hypothetical protein JI667_21370, partial [Bacillus sp. NTK074B]|nr:hypothetical protein [Bacillus sp. NTK074B]
IDSTFDQDLEQIRELMLAMGGRVEEAITLSAKALEERDEDLAQNVVEGDHAVDRLEEEIDQNVVRLLALRQPQAGDLRAVIAVLVDLLVIVYVSAFVWQTWISALSRTERGEVWEILGG